ncbi:MAG: FAD-dependent oxidoreductase [Planctomycetota bacterium]|jgi:2-polyprenyl-6-methoxyphenol hydroxylase-like FAD-dependent oxidoreductase
MDKGTEPEVLVIGAGPVGLFTALLLEQRGVRTQVVDEESRTSAHSYALALHPHSLRLLDQAGVAAELIQQGHRVDRVALYDGAERQTEMKLSELPGDFPFLLVLPQSVLEDFLVRKLSSRGVDVLWDHRLSGIEARGERAFATIDALRKLPYGYASTTTKRVVEQTRRTETAFLVGADGHASFVRRTLAIDFEPVSPPESFAVLEFHFDADLGSEARVVLDEHTTNVLWPLPGGCCRWSLQLHDSEPPVECRSKSRLAVPVDGEAFQHISDKYLRTLVRARAPWFEGSVSQVTWTIEVRFDRRMAGLFGRDRFWLVGDAAHLAGPVGVQSLNMGLREAHDLAETLFRILRKGAGLDELEAYNHRYRAEWRRLHGIEGTLAPTRQAEPWVKAQRARILPCIPASGDDFERLARQLGLNEKKGSGVDS